MMTLTAAQTTWLTTHSLEVCESSSTFTIKPVNACWAHAPFCKVEQAREGFQVVHVSAKTTASYCGPVGQVLSTHATLKAALAALLAR